MRSRVRSVVRDTAGTFVTDTDVNNWLEEASLDVATRLKALQEEATEADLTETSNGFELPADFLGVISLRLGADDVHFLDAFGWSDWSDSGATPPRTLGRIFNNQIELYPTPDSGFTYTLRYYRKAAALSDSEEAELPESFHIKLVNYARAHAKYKDDRGDEGDRYMGMYEQGLPQVSREKDRLFPTPAGWTPEPGPFDNEEAIHQ